MSNTDTPAPGIHDNTSGVLDTQMADEGCVLHYDWIVIDTDGTCVAWASTRAGAETHARDLGIL